MSGGRLVVLDRNGRDVKRYPLPSGLATLGSDPACDIRVMLPSVSAHHATIVVHSNQTVVRNVSGGDTLVNGEPVSVAALGHGDVVSVGGRSLRWEYSEPTTARGQKTEPALAVWRRGARRGRVGRLSAAWAAPSPGLAREPALRLALEMTQRASMPGSTGGKQVAVVQPQRRDAKEQDDKASPGPGGKRPRSAKSEAEPPEADREGPTRGPALGTTQATLWIESRKSSPRRSAKLHTPLQAKSRRSLPCRAKGTPLRLAVLKRAQSAHRPRPTTTKIQAPLLIDQTKRAAILLMTGHTPKSRLLAPAPAVKRPSPGTGAGGRKPSRASPGNKSVRQSAKSEPRRSRRSPRTSPPLPSPRKSALRAPGAKRPSRKNDSIKFDLSNLEDRPADDEAPRPRRSGRGSLMLRRALDGSQAGLESYSIVDLVSVDSDDSVRSASVYGSAGSDASAAFGTPSDGARRPRPSSSTPYLRAAGSSPRSRSSLASTTLGASRLSLASTASRADSQSTPENSEDARKQVTLTDVRKSRGSRSRSRIDDSDLVFVDDDDADDSPRSSRRARSRSGASERTPARAASAEQAGTSTPENAHSPEEATTPVLSIQSLLDSSRGSGASRGSSRRSTPAVPPSRRTADGTIASLASDRSSNFTARKTRLRLSSDSVEEVDDGPLDEEEAVTPRSAAKPSPEAVKNKHSTAKKPQSKRSIIDDLDESDVVKQLFNSPVKRKLSQSMTELSRRKVFADEETRATRRPARNTYAGETRTPDGSLLDRSDAYTPERFVSPVTTPGRSPDLGGVGRLFRRSGPADDLTDVRGVKALLRTPRATSARNDLSDVAGVKAVFGRSPRNRLSDVRLKEVFARPPADDLRRVTGLPALFRRSARKSPRNDLSDVRGVKRLFAGAAPADDLTNVSGVKGTMRRNSPRNDYTDVRGVRRMFGKRTSKKDSLGDVSGVEELFDASARSREDSETLFDRLVGKPTIRAVYSKTFVAKRTPKTKRRPRKSLGASLDLITDNVERWLERELQKRLHAKDGTEAADKSNRNLTRELQKLATDTVEGNTPLRSSRIRVSAVAKSGDGRKRSASDVYGAHTLPIKKRSLVEKSIEKPSLPIKKRVVVHSTPVKGRINLTMNASELGRVSPIAVVDKTAAADHETSIRLIQHAEETVKPRGPRRTKFADEDRLPPPPQFKAPSPRKTRGKAKAASPRKPKTASPSKAKGGSPSTSKRVSPVKTKQSPAKAKEPSPVKPRATRHAKVKLTLTTPAEETKPVSPAKAAAKGTRSARTRKNASPAEANVKKRRASIVIAKKAPAMSPKPPATRNKRPAKAAPEPAKVDDVKPTRKTRAKTDTKVEQKVKSPKKTRTKTQKVAKAPSSRAKATPKVQSQEPNKPKRGRAAKVESPKESPVKAERKTRGNDTRTVSTARNRKTVEKQESKESAPATTRRGRKTTAAEPTDHSKTLKAVEPKETKSRGRSRKVEAQESVQSEPPTRGRRAAQQDTTAPVNTRKRKATTIEQVPTKVAKASAGGRGRKAPEPEPVPTPVPVSGRQKRGAVVAAASPGAPRTRGKKVADVSKAVAVTGTRKRKKSAEPSPVKGGRARRR